RFTVGRAADRTGRCGRCSATASASAATATTARRAGPASTARTTGATSLRCGSLGRQDLNQHQAEDEYGHAGPSKKSVSHRSLLIEFSNYGSVFHDLQVRSLALPKHGFLVEVAFVLH